VRRFRQRPPGGYGPVIACIIVTYVLATAVSTWWTVAVLLVAQIGTVWWAVRTSGAHAGLRFGAGLAFALALLAGAANLVTDDTWLIGLAFLIGSVLYLVAPLSIVTDLARRRHLDRDLMAGALAAYLMLGMAFAFAYKCVAVFQPGPFYGPVTGDGTLADSLFFSFVTLTTTGYGNAVPAGNPGQGMAVLEALIGQLFLVIAVSKIVNIWQPRAWRDRPPGNERTGS
jgi:ion channel